MNSIFVYLFTLWAIPHSFFISRILLSTQADDNIRYYFSKTDQKKICLNDWRSAIVRTLSQELKGENRDAIANNLISMKRQLKDFYI